MFLLIFLLLAPGDWTDWRGPERDGVSSETGLPDGWSPQGENLLWKAPYGGRSAPVVLRNRLYLQNGSGSGETLQERILCFDIDSGKVLWEHRFNIYQSDVPPHRVGWASPVADPATGNVYAFGVGGTLLGLSEEGKLLWERSLGEDFGLITTHGGRTVSPIIEGNLVIVSGVASGWGDLARPGQRFLAFDKQSGETVWISSPGGRPYDTTYSPPIAAEINGMRLLIAGGGDGAVHALKPLTGEPVWRFEMSKRGINTGAVTQGNRVIVSHSEENLDTSEMGLLAAIDGAAQGELGAAHVFWKQTGFLSGFSSPVIDGDRIYQIDNGAKLFAFSLSDGRMLWREELGTIQKASPVLADGKLYVGTENGKFFILKPSATGCAILDEDQLGTEQLPEAIIASAAVSNGRIYVVSDQALYCIGSASSKSSSASPHASHTASASQSPDLSRVAHVQVVPADTVLLPGEVRHFQARLFDRQGKLLGEAKPSWSLQQLTGEIGPDGRFSASSEARPQAGKIQAKVGEVTGTAQVRVIPPLPWALDMDELAGETVPRHWINATGKFVLREVEGNKVLVKLADNPATRRARVYMGPPDWSNYTVEVDFLAHERRRQLGDAGLIAQRYALILFGNHQRLELQSWQPETKRTASVRFPWKADTWYRMKLAAESPPDGPARIRGKVWLRDQPEPSEWTIEKVDPMPNRTGSPGIYADAPYEIYFDHLKVGKNP